MIILVSNTPGVSRHIAPLVERKNKKDLVFDDHEVKEMLVLLISPEAAVRAAACLKPTYVRGHKHRLRLHL